MRVRTLPQAVKEIRSIDSRSAVNEDMLISLIKDKHLSHSSHGVRTVIEFGILQCRALMHLIARKL